jgi:hypothetical protein
MLGRMFCSLVKKAVVGSKDKILGFVRRNRIPEKVGEILSRYISTAIGIVVSIALFPIFFLAVATDIHEVRTSRLKVV